MSATVIRVSARTFNRKTDDASKGNSTMVTDPIRTRHPSGSRHSPRRQCAIGETPGAHGAPEDRWYPAVSRHHAYRVHGSRACATSLFKARGRGASVKQFSIGRRSDDAIQISGFAIPFSGSRRSANTSTEQSVRFEGHAIAHHVVGRARQFVRERLGGERTVFLRT